MRKTNALLFVVLALIINTTMLFGASMKATFSINGKVMTGTITADRIFMDGYVVTTQPCSFTFTDVEGRQTAYPCGTSVEYIPSKIMFFTAEGLEVTINFNSNDGHIFNSKDNYAVGIYELSSGCCIYNSSNNSDATSVRKIFANNNLILANERVYVVQYTICDGVTIRQKFMVVDNQFLKGE